MDAGCSLEARPASHRLLQPFSPCFLHTPSSPGHASLCSIIPSSLGTSPLPPPPLGMLVLHHHPSSPGYASFYSAASTSFGYASLCSITPLASPVGTLPPAPSPLLLWVHFPMLLWVRFPPLRHPPLLWIHYPLLRHPLLRCVCFPLLPWVRFPLLVTAQGNSRRGGHRGTFHSDGAGGSFPIAAATYC